MTAHAGIGGAPAHGGRGVRALWNLGFRPFYLLASIYSALSVLAWAAQFAGRLPAAVIAAVAVAGALAHAARLYLWQPWRTLSMPLVWILHAAYAWIVVHLALRGLSALDLCAASYATHALTVGAIGGLTLWA